jgi:hypothetical protein
LKIQLEKIVIYSVVIHLKDSFGGAPKTLMTATISPAEDSSNETLSNLKFAQRSLGFSFKRNDILNRQNEIFQVKQKYWKIYNIK